MTAALLLVFEGLILLILGLDLSLGFLLLSSPVRVALAAGAAAALGLLLALRRRLPRTPLPALLVLAVSGLVLAGLGGLEARAIRLLSERWETGASERLEARARILEEDFRQFLGDLVRPIDPADVSVEERRAAFTALLGAQRRSRLPAERLGFSIYGSDGTLIGWQGNSAGPPRDVLSIPCPGPSYGTGGGRGDPPPLRGPLLRGGRALGRGIRPRSATARRFARRRFHRFRLSAALARGRSRRRAPARGSRGAGRPDAAIRTPGRPLLGTTGE